MDKEKFKIAIEEVVVAEFVVEAMDAEDAMKIAEEKYKSGEIVIYGGEVQQRQMAIIFPKEAASEWKEF
ncbi:hypothetical protein [Phascolarctobacterium sp.]|uniref:hypothetical protein n=1 Tax=Phascolarctobacterium sp. TaxID=2049039 RepID=UPI00386BB59C